MFRTISFALFLFIDLSCCDTLTGNVRRVTDQVIETQISTTTDKEFWSTTSSGVDSDDFDMRLTSEETTETTQITSSYDDDVYLNNGSVCEIRNVTYKSYSDSIEIEWYDCGDTYNVNRNKSVFDDKEMPDFRRLVNNSTYKFAKLEECTPYNISIKSYSGDEYLKTIRTLPGEIQDLTTYIEGNVTYVNWSLPESQDCQTFNIQINEMVMTQIKNNSLEINYDVSRCTRIKINAVDINNTIGNISTRQVPGTVLDFSPIFYEDNITLSWKPPEDMTCVTGYVVQLNDEAVLLNDSSTTGYSFTGLQACTEYTVGVAVRSSTDVGEYLYVTDKTDTPTIIAAVESFQLVILNDTLRATWEPPSSQSACITGYGVVMWSDSATVTNSTTDTYYNFTPTVPCKTYNVMIKAMIGTNEGISTIESTTIDPAATDAPTLKSIVVNETSATITLKLEDYTSNMCQVTMVIVNCTAEGNQPSDWIIEERHVEHSHTDPSREASILVDDISAYTHYVCYAYVINTGGESEESVAIEFRTLEGVPSEPRNLAYTVDDHIVITWTEPLTIPGVLGNYSVKIEGINPLHYIPQDCSVYPSKIDEQTGGLQFHFNDYSFNYKYKLVVAASTGAGFGDEATINITTPVGEPEAPRDISHTSSHEKLEVNWKAPCNTNGELIEFRWTLEGQQLEDGDNLTSINGTVLANEDVSNVTYGLSIENIQARYLYTFTLAAYTIGDLRGIETNFTLVSADGFPSAPQNVTLVEVNATSAEISWAVPLTTNGLIVSYLLVLNTTGPKHYIPENCPVDYTDSIKIEPESTKLSYILESVMPYFQYNVSVSAATTAGYGDAVSVDFITLQAEPEAPRNVNYKLNNVLAETYNATLHVDWLLPCNINGNLTYFVSVLEGISAVTLESVRETSFTLPNDPVDDITYELEISLLPMYNYTLMLRAFVDEGRIGGYEYMVEFYSPDGYSSPPTDLKVENLTATTGSISWEEPLAPNGEIHSYQIAITTDGPVHYIPGDCDFTYDDIVVNTTLDSTALEFPFTGFPNFKYSVAVFAVNGAGYGFENTIYFTTLSTQPDAPRYIDHTHNMTENNTDAVTIKWLQPCNTNGNLINFAWVLWGYSLETGDVHNDSGIIKSNDPLNDTLYELTLSNLLPYHTYNVSIAARVEGDILGEEMVQGFISNDGLPSAPSGLESTNISSSLIVVIWKEPYPRNGEIQTYRVTVSSQGPLYEVPQDCAIDIASNDPQKLPSDLLTFTVTDAQPNFKYIIGIAASTRTGYGDESLIELESLPTDPESLENIKTEINYNQTENYEAEAIMTFDKQCNLHGDFSHYEVDIFGTRSMSYNVEFVRNITTYETNQLTIPLTPDFRYYGHIIIHTTTGHKTTIIESFVAPAGVPAVSTANIESPKANPTNATFTLSNEIFNNSGGNIKYYAIIISIGNDLLQNVGGTYAFWNESSWPEVGFWSATAMEHEYQATPERWNPFVNASETTEHTYVIGGNNCSSTSNIYCNGPLRPNTRYGLRIRGFTAAAYRDTRMVYFTTPTERSYLALILGVIFGALAAILVLLFIFILWRRRKKETVDAKETLVVVQTPKPPPIPKSRFEEHCQMFEGNRNELKAEYSHLEGLSAAGKPSSDVAMADNNKKKNRYVNIMAYDVTRVKLTINNNDNCEDYINASYIKGYSGNHEYIATQGPMESTLEDFWRMIVQEDVGLIVMVAQFVEQSKQKCYKYFPEKEETMTIGKGDILVKCTNEADMTDYVTRSLIVEKDGEQLMIKHLQFMLWPDFGCPTTTHSMLEFRDIMRKHIEVTKTKAVIHCSAGVGRTGTLIAIDILLQKIDNSDDDIDVFGTVLDLRRQRTHMVQTEKQYEYIHKCLRDYLIKPKQASDDAGDFDPIYENVAVLNGYSDRLHNENNLSTENLIRLKEL